MGERFKKSYAKTSKECLNCKPFSQCDGREECSLETGCSLPIRVFAFPFRVIIATHLNIKGVRD